jgi:hypothetical protein
VKEEGRRKGEEKEKKGKKYEFFFKLGKYLKNKR